MPLTFFEMFFFCASLKSNLVSFLYISSPICTHGVAKARIEYPGEKDIGNSQVTQIKVVDRTGA